MLYQLSYLAKQRLILLATKTRGFSRVLYQLSYLAKRRKILLATNTQLRRNSFVPGLVVAASSV